MDGLEHISVIEKRKRWKEFHRRELLALRRSLNLLPQTLDEVIDGKRTTATLQPERELAKLGCPGFERYAQ